MTFTTNGRGDGGASKSVDKAGTSGAPTQNAGGNNANKVNGGNQSGQYVSLNSKDANGIGNVPVGVKEKRLS